MTSPDVELSVIAPCLNEELNVPELTRRTLAVFEKGGFAGELILIDDGSTDGTAQVIRSMVAAHPEQVQAVFHPQNRGMAAAWKSGAGVARGRLVATIDSDLQYQPEDLLRLRRALYEHSVDVVQGWRSWVGRVKDERYHISRAFNFMLNGAFGMHLADNKSGFVMCAREVFQDLLTYEGRYFYWQSFIMVAAHAKGYDYKEIETLFEQRKAGESFLAKKAAQGDPRLPAKLRPRCGRRQERSPTAQAMISRIGWPRSISSRLRPGTSRRRGSSPNWCKSVAWMSVM